MSKHANVEEKPRFSRLPGDGLIVPEHAHFLSRASSFAKCASSGTLSAFRLNTDSLNFDL
jgi:hypothetical protein